MFNGFENPLMGVLNGVIGCCILMDLKIRTKCYRFYDFQIYIKIMCYWFNDS